MDGPAPTFAIYPLLTKSVKVLSTVTLLISGQSSMISFLVIFPTLLSIIDLILLGLEILRCFRYKCLQFGFISVILAFDDGDFNRYDGDRIPIMHENYSYILRLPPRGWYNQWRMHKVTGWQCKAPGAHSRKSERRRESKCCDVYVLHSLISTTARQLAPDRGSDIRAVVGEV